MNDYLKFCLKFFDRILQVEKRGTYSYTEISNVVRAIENEIDKVDPARKEELISYLDLFYKEIPCNDFGLYILQMQRIRPVFHRPLKDAGIDPLKS